MRGDQDRAGNINLPNLDAWLKVVHRSGTGGPPIDKNSKLMVLFPDSLEQSLGSVTLQSFHYVL